MGLLDSFEKGLERAVNSAFAKTFRSGLQPVEIASALRSELDKKAAIVTRDRVLAPNSFTVRLNPADAERMSALGSALTNELDEVVRAHAAKQGYSFPGPVSISLRTDDQVAAGTLGVDSVTAEGRVEWRAVVEISGRRHPLAQARTVIGRGSDADITIPDPGTSRKHVEVLWDGRSAMVRDLGSTNGSKLDGRQVAQSALANGQVITIGRTDIVFRLVPLAAPAQRVPRDDAATELYDFRGGGR
ncbi:DUF3662 and FHA domain-containing protein [Microbacterium betulae]|uniref:DUF3662 and FHA domain-containing protein n=1 Tax=Microbacterium betulae TaxID=2981139 RepID=A0AA97FGH6_9MICO|nr:DUF3662 and FHA domain-containing protein [Microbacterium sp. AB]WOF23106.1 DUF3662 and FHA domain-containing protein [Microbacterium sp. AB]